MDPTGQILWNSLHNNPEVGERVEKIIDETRLSMSRSFLSSGIEFLRSGIDGG